MCFSWRIWLLGGLVVFSKGNVTALPWSWLSIYWTNQVVSRKEEIALGWSKAPLSKVSPRPQKYGTLGQTYFTKAQSDCRADVGIRHS